MKIEFKALIWCFLEALVLSISRSYVNVGITIATAGYFTNSLIDGAPAPLSKHYQEWVRKLREEERNSYNERRERENLSKIRETEYDSDRNSRLCHLCGRKNAISFAKVQNCQHILCNLCLHQIAGNKCPIDGNELSGMDISYRGELDNANDRFEIGESSNSYQPSAPIENENGSFETEHGVRVHFEGYQNNDRVFEMCAICGKRNVATFAKSSKCEHLFCDSCLLKWVKRNEQCPYDRTAITDVHIYNNIHHSDYDERMPQPQLTDFADSSTSSSDTEKGVEQEQRETLANGVILRRVKNARRKMPLSHCPICMETNVSLLAKSSKCEHMFCAPCLQKWVKQNGICPIDRSKIECIDIYDSRKKTKKIISRRNVKYMCKQTFLFIWQTVVIFAVLKLLRIILKI